MAQWSVSSVTVDPLSAQPGITGIQQEQTLRPGEVIPGLWVAEIWTADRSTMILQDKDHGLAPAGRGGSLQFVSSIMPEGDVMVFSYHCPLTDPDEKLSQEWHRAAMPSAGWSRQQISLHWQG